MARPNLLKKGTLLVPSGPPEDPDRMHLHVICTDPDEIGRQLVVSIASLKGEHCDRTCVLQSFEHENLRWESFVEYRFAEILLNEKLALGVQAHIFEPCPDLNNNSFLRVTRGILVSKQTSQRIKGYYLSRITPDKSAA